MEKLYKKYKLGGYAPKYPRLMQKYFYSQQLGFGSKNIGN